jgi:hypothetical protein
VVEEVRVVVSGAAVASRCPSAFSTNMRGRPTRPAPFFGDRTGALNGALKDRAVGWRDACVGYGLDAPFLPVIPGTPAGSKAAR